uniref:Uncharacterized protein n=1 Tax=Podoviridae sp. ctlpi2 TaxID=2826574 RepID=A0A8S5MLC5_9CAUD|nr:MAG TPA: hypothetical protein [Podoviridae sp. ctlpi2]
MALAAVRLFLGRLIYCSLAPPSFKKVCLWRLFLSPQALVTSQADFLRTGHEETKLRP